MGWKLALDAMKQEFWEDPTGDDRPAYFVPQSRLRDAQELKAYKTHPIMFEWRAAIR